MVKYKQYFQEMLEQNQAAFAAFKKIHDLYQQDRFAHQVEFNRQGTAALEIVRLFEKRLCSRMEGGNKGVYSSRVAEKFRQEVKNAFPLIDRVGITVIQPPQQ